MNAMRVRSKNPLLYLMAFFFWYGLERLVWDVLSAEKLLDKFPKRKKIVRKAIHIICGILALVLAAFFLGAIGRLTGLDLVD